MSTAGIVRTGLMSIVRAPILVDEEVVVVEVMPAVEAVDRSTSSPIGSVELGRRRKAINSACTTCTR
jgi:hypothetical protein